MITYKEDPSRTRTDVLLDGKKVGQIIPSASGGYRYRAKGGDLGEIFETVEAVKRSLESEEA